MSFINSLISKFLGTKAQRDLKETQPIVEKIKAAYQEVINLSNDQLREHSANLKLKIKEYIKEDEAQIVELKKQGENEQTPVDEIEKIYTQLKI